MGEVKEFIMQKQCRATQYFVYVLLGLIAVSCNPSNPTQFTSVTTPTASLTALTETSLPVPLSTSVSIITPQEALEQMYGKEARIHNNEGSITSSQGNIYNIRINLFTCYWDGLGFEKCLVITDRSESIACHGCGAYIDGAIFSRTHGGWNLHSFQSKIAKAGSFGNAPKGELVQIGTGKYAVLFKSVYANQGSETENLVMITETENGLGIVLQLISGRKNIIFDEYQKEVTNWGWNSRLEFQPDENDSNYYQIVVTYYGTDENGKTPPLQVYKFSDTKYVLFYEEK